MAVKPACEAFFPLLSPFVDGELPPSDRVKVERHLAACQDCTGRVADIRAESGLLRVGMEMLTDDVDFSQFTQSVMARITPERPPLWERLRLSLGEMFTYQRGPLLAAGLAAVLVIVAIPLFLRASPPEGYAQEKMAVRSVTTDANAHVAPVVLETEAGDSIIWVVDHDHVSDQLGAPDAAGQIQIDSGQGPDNKGESKPPEGGEL